MSWYSFHFIAQDKSYWIEGQSTTLAEKILESVYGLKAQGCSIYSTGTFGAMRALYGVNDEDLKEPKFNIYRPDIIPATLKSPSVVSPGEFCKFCENFFPMASANQADGTLVCWSCRDSNSWRLTS